MAFRPEDIYTVAKRLHDRDLPTEEGRYRTIVGRAYYSAYWAACEAVCKQHGINPVQSIKHEVLCDTLAAYEEDSDVKAFGTLLNTLRKSRVHADYKLSKPLAEYYADDAVEDARTAMDMIPSVQHKLPKIDTF
jgi:uncharacterized protein (UPF0332 family)